MIWLPCVYDMNNIGMTWLLFAGCLQGQAKYFVNLCRDTSYNYSAPVRHDMTHVCVYDLNEIGMTWLLFAGCLQGQAKYFVNLGSGTSYNYSAPVRNDMTHVCVYDLNQIGMTRLVSAGCPHKQSQIHWKFFRCHFPQKSPVIRGSFADRTLQHYRAL